MGGCCSCLTPTVSFAWWIIKQFKETMHKLFVFALFSTLFILFNFVFFT